jgi:hypothetical protein
VVTQLFVTLAFVCVLWNALIVIFEVAVGVFENKQYKLVSFANILDPVSRDIHTGYIY